MVESYTSYIENASVNRNMGWDVQQGGCDAPVKLAGEALVLGLGPETGDASVLAICVELELEPDGVVDSTQETHA
jgi:hypothetical protein